jgi:ABC-type bacteriocin/lantibiotic exporter with double-glycine peptidase domain
MLILFVVPMATVDIAFVVASLAVLIMFGWHLWPYILALLVLINVLVWQYESWQKRNLRKYQEKIGEMAKEAWGSK